MLRNLALAAIVVIVVLRIFGGVRDRENDPDIGHLQWGDDE
jgi:hypothetical protein